MGLAQCCSFHAEKEAVATCQLTPGVPRSQANPQSRPAASHVNPPSLLPPSLCCQAWELLEAPPSAQPTRPVHEAILILLWGPLSSRCEPIACSSMLTPCSHRPHLGPALLIVER